MTREDAIRWMTVLKQSKINWIGDTNKIADIKAECEKAEQEAFDMAIEALSAVCDDCIWHVCNYNKVDWDVLSAEAVHGWIPVTERLPEEYGEYLVTKRTIGWNYEEYGSNDIAYFDSDGFHKADKVTAWMPLPEPYKGGDDA